MEGILIVFEGIDGAGKTTQVNLLADALRAAGENVVQSKEPTDGRWGKQVRDSARTGRLSLEDELRLFVEDRKEHVANTIRPALDRGEIVILDRYYFSTIAYQGSRGADTNQIHEEMKAVAPRPDVVFLIDADPAITLGRIENDRGEVPNHFEKLDSLRLVREIFLSLRSHDKSILQIDGQQRIESVYSTIVHLLVSGVLKTKRCAKSYDCDVLYCSYRQSGTCPWYELAKKLPGGTMSALVQ